MKQSNFRLATFLGLFFDFLNSLKGMRPLLKILLGMGLTLFLTAQNQLVSAQTEGLLLDPSVNLVEIDFPRSIEFRLEADLGEEIDRVTLYYGTAGLSCREGGARQRVDINKADPLDASWNWDLIRSGSLPPGTEIWWQWEVRNAAGTLWVSERNNATILDDGPDWRMVSSDGVTVNWYRGDQAFGNAMLNEAVTSVERISADMGVPPPPEIQLWIYPNAAAVQGAVLNVPEWTGGVAFPEYSSTVLGVAPGELDWAKQIIPHELSHLVVGSQVFNCNGVRLPTWLNEGLARYAETLQDENDLKELDRALENNRLSSLRSLANGFSAYSNSASLAYTQSYQVVAYLIETYGPNQMSRLLETMRDGTTVDFALEEVYGFDTDGLDIAWRASKGYFVTPTPDLGGIEEATPTIVPTISFGLPVVGGETPEPTETAVPTAEPTQEPTSEPSPTSSPVPEPTDETIIADASEVLEVEESSEAIVEDPASNSSFLMIAVVGLIVLMVILIGGVAYNILKK